MPDYTPIRDPEDKELRLINVKKYLMITEIVNSLFQYQKLDLEKKEPIYSFLVCPPILTEDDLEARSQEIDKEI